MVATWRTLPWFLLAGLAAGAGVWFGEITNFFDFGATRLVLYLLAVIAAGTVIGARLVPPWRWARGALWAFTLLVGEILGLAIGAVLFFNP